MTADLAWASVGELRDLLDRRAVSAGELTRISLERLGRMGPRYGALACLLEERALDEARRADRAIGRGRRSPLLGIPYGAKDLLAARGGPTAWGSPAYRDQVFDEDAGAIERLDRAGAVLAAKLSLMELAAFHGMHPAGSIDGPGRNPWDPTRWAAGSSNGSAAAVAAGLVPFSLGSETGGSIGSPSAYCGVTGLRPTFGLVSRRGAMALAWTLDRIGPMARSVADLSLVLPALAGPDRRDPMSSGRQLRTTAIAAARARGTAGIRVGWAPTDIEEAAHPPVRAALRQGIGALGETGVELVETALDPSLPYLATLIVVLNAEGGAAFEDLIGSERFGLVIREEQRRGMRESLGILARDYLRAMRVRRLIIDSIRGLLTRVDVLVSYTLPGEPTPVDEPFAVAPMTGGNTALVAASNLAGLPALFLPVGLSDNGLPVGIQLVGRPFSEPLLLALGERFQAVSDWHRLRPPVDEEVPT